MNQEEPKPSEPTAQPAAAKPEPAVPRASFWEVYFPKRHTGPRETIYVASFPTIIYFWPSIVVLFVCGMLQWLTSISPGTLGWISVLVVAFNVLVLVQDFDQKKFLILILALTAAGLGVWLINVYGFTFLKDFARWLINLKPEFSTSAYFVLSGILFVQFLWGLLIPFFDYWTLEHNEFVHYCQPFGRDISIPRQESTVTKAIPDMLEFLLAFGGGSLVIKREGHTWATIPHIPFLSFRMRAIERMLSETRVTTFQ